MTRLSLVSLTALFLFLSARNLVGQKNRRAGRPLWTVLNCQAKATKDMNLGDDQSVHNSDSIKIMRHNSFLDVTVNGDEFKKRFGDSSLVSDIYLINGFGVRSINATHTVSQDSIVHTLIIDIDGKQALWTETGYSWTSPFRPFGSMVLLTCK
jgi:hypothetical protein